MGMRNDCIDSSTELCKALKKCVDYEAFHKFPMNFHEWLGLLAICMGLYCLSKMINVVGVSIDINKKER